ncbi:hypothetical protein KC19_4G073200 [Ceratodon purpureus]|uniref:Uncharacterized protein n=1 Tax=Ceratodon purpureus TaxID=3225 RepID=A0A8T0I9F7_CERPU|nr:hypothetical protein KC19_4G073200 [Ceratodon purpureus]
MERATENLSSSCSGSSVPSLPKYDVFLNHRGPDSKRTFISHLYEALCEAGHPPFLDAKSLVKGTAAFSSINEAISGTLVHVAILSPRYAESKYCLNELCEMLATGKPIIPVFYNVKPKDLRHVEVYGGLFYEAFLRHSTRRGCEEVSRWKEALQAVSELKGLSLSDCNGGEMKLVKKVVAAVLKLLPALRQLEDSNQSSCVINTLHSMGDDVGLLGIYGTSGIGKTTIAHEVYINERLNFQHCCFLTNVKDSKGVNFMGLQMKMVTELLQVDAMKMQWDFGRWFEKIQNQKVFLVIDDITEKEQFDELIPDLEKLAPGSRVLITSCEKDILQTIIDAVTQGTVQSALHEVPKLSFSDSLRVFIWCAFQENNLLAVDASLHDLVNKITTACCGLPLALEVMGRFLAKKKKLPEDLKYWQEAIMTIGKDEEIISSLYDFGLHDFYVEKKVTISRSVDKVYCFQSSSKKDLQDSEMVILELLRRMEELELNNVRIWSNQCTHLLEKFRVGVDIVLGALHFLNASGDEGPMVAWYAPLVKFLCCMLEGEALLLSCCENHYNMAAFALSSPPPSVPAFSRFALLLRELDWTLDFICYVKQPHIDEVIPMGKWRWSEEKCRFYSEMEFPGIQDETLESDVHRQTKDREALQAALNANPIGQLSATPPSVNDSASMLRSVSSLATYCFPFRTKRKLHDEEVIFRNAKNQDLLEGIWKKRLLGTSPDSPSSSSTPTDCFYIDNLDRTNKEWIAIGASKTVKKCKWLGVTVAVAVMSMSEEQVKAEVDLLARVRHPNVVELLGYAHKDDISYPKGYIVTELMEQDLTSLIKQKRKNVGPPGIPFVLPVALDIALQIVEAMIHLKECGVLHRDLKPKNCLVCSKFMADSLPAECSDIPMFYTIKLIDFGDSKLRGQDSNFWSYNRGTPAYMAPEIYERSKDLYTWPADVYSFGMTCYEIFTGRAPFKAFTKFSDIQEFICSGGRPLFPRECPRVLKELIEKCWAQNPNDRPKFQDIRKDLWHCKSYAYNLPFEL